MNGISLIIEDRIKNSRETAASTLFRPLYLENISGLTLIRYNEV